MCCHSEFGIFVTKSNERTEDSFESRSPPFCLTFFHSTFSHSRWLVCSPSHVLSTSDSLADLEHVKFCDGFSTCCRPVDNKSEDTLRTSFAAPPSTKLCQNWLHHWRGTLYLYAAVHWCGQRPLKGLGTSKTVEATQYPSTHVNMRRIHPGLKKKTEKKKRKKKERKKKECHLDSNDFGFIHAGVSNMVSYKRNVWYNLSCLLQTEHQRKTVPLADTHWQWLKEGCHKPALGVWSEDVPHAAISTVRWNHINESQASKQTWFIRDRGKGLWRWGKREITYLSLHCHHQNDSCIKMGSNESRFNVSLTGEAKSQDSVHNWREKRAQVGSNQGPSAYQPNALPLGQTSSRTTKTVCKHGA